ncbi:MAG: MBL fold metallo-hydrolase [Woeseiaceae bacterium]|nr:MBL fold metallo-hydrolase [Woeseiaceae bacterium]
MWACALLAAPAIVAAAEEFCLDGEFDLGARYQGLAPAAGELYPTRWCVISDEASGRVFFAGSGRSNPDMHGDWSVAYLPPDVVRIVNRSTPPDVEFRPVDVAAEARRIRRLDPLRLIDEWQRSSGRIDGLDTDVIEVNGDVRPARVRAMADLPLRGRVPVVWEWDWRNPERPAATLLVDGDVVMRATGRWRTLSDDSPWQRTHGPEPVAVPGDNWPARVSMHLEKLADGVYLVQGVRTGFQHLVIDTEEGLVVGDAPAGWVELHHLPPSDLVPGLGISGLSERLIDFLAETLPGRPLRAVVLTHHHDDHAGGARAFAAAGASIYAARESAMFLATALNRESMPADALSRAGHPAAVSPVDEALTVGNDDGTGNRARILPIGAGPHSDAMLGLWAVDRGIFFVSDVHVPRSDADAPSPHRAATECWFAAWATTNLPGDVRVANSHSAPLTPVSRLKRYLDSDLCRS